MTYWRTSDRRLRHGTLVAGTIGIACLTAAAIGLALAVLPSSWVGHPWLELAHRIEGTSGEDVPVALTWFARIEGALLSMGIAFLLAGNPRWWWGLWWTWRWSDTIREFVEYDARDDAAAQPGDEPPGPPRQRKG